MTHVDLAAARSTLDSERSRLVHQLDELGANENGDLRAGRDFGDGSFADAGAATAERTEVLGLVETLKSQLDDIELALGRIEAGTYGLCASCGKEIPAVRLEALPASILCVDCKARLG
jgi:DnaK suppressor protein